MRENDRNYPLRRQSAINDFKPKVIMTVSHDILRIIYLANFRSRSGQKSRPLLSGRKLMRCLWWSRKVPIQFYRRITANWRGIFELIFMFLGQEYLNNLFSIQRYLRVPTIPHGCSSGDSLFSTSSGRMGTPPEISSAASSADENEDEKSRFY